MSPGATGNNGSESGTQWERMGLSQGSYGKGWVCVRDATGNDGSESRTQHERMGLSPGCNRAGWV